MTLSLRDPPIPDSAIAAWDPRWKLASLILFGIGVALMRQPLSAAILAGLVLVLCSVARIPFRAVRERLFLVLLAVLPALVVLPLTGDLTPDSWTLGRVSISSAGLTTALTILGRAVALGLLALLLLRTTPFPEILAAAHALRIPGLIIQLVQLAYRYSFLFFEEARRIRISLRTRGFRANVSLNGYRTLGHAAGTLLLRGSDRAERVSEAMRCRGFTGEFHSLTEFRTRTRDVLGCLALVLLVLVLLVWDRGWHSWM
jgi:cobalt/nickel transport system permease protein